MAGNEFKRLAFQKYGQMGIFEWTTRYLVNRRFHRCRKEASVNKRLAAVLMQDTAQLSGKSGACLFIVLLQTLTLDTDPDAMDMIALQIFKTGETLRREQQQGLVSPYIIQPVAAGENAVHPTGKAENKEQCSVRILYQPGVRFFMQ